MSSSCPCRCLLLAENAVQFWSRHQNAWRSQTHQQKVKKWATTHVLYLKSTTSSTCFRQRYAGHGKRFFNLSILWPNWILFVGHVFAFVPQSMVAISAPNIKGHIPRWSIWVHKTQPNSLVLMESSLETNTNYAAEFQLSFDFSVAPLPVSFLSLWPCGTLSRCLKWRSHGMKWRIFQPCLSTRGFL